MSEKHTYEEIADSYRLWAEYVDPNGEMTEEEFVLIPSSSGLRFLLLVSGEGFDSMGYKGGSRIFGFPKSARFGCIPIMDSFSLSRQNSPLQSAN